MVKKNNAIPHTHGRKHWNPCASQRGNIKVWLNQPGQKQRRRRLRQLKAIKVFPRPLRMLRPIVTCPTVRYNMKHRLGRGFTLEELKDAKVNPKYAATIGIRVDRRRRNHCQERLDENVCRLKTYMSKLILFPRRTAHKKKYLKAVKTHKKKAEDDTLPALETLKQDTTRDLHLTVPSVQATVRDVMPLEPSTRPRTEEEAKTNVYKTLRKNINAVRFLGQRLKRAQRKAERQAEQHKKGSK